MPTTYLRPGLLVSLKSTVTGGVRYNRTTLDAPQATGAAEVSRWETIKVVVDPAEHEEAIKIRGRCRTMILSLCTKGEFCLAPADKEFDLLRTIDEAQKLARDFNARARSTRVEVYAIVGRVAESDEQAARAIGAEIRALLDTMRTGIQAADVEAIRKAANEARDLGRMLSDEVQGKVSAAIEEARTAARAIVKRITKEGEQAASVVADLKIDEINRAAYAFLDLDGARAFEPLPVTAQGALDLGTPAEPQITPPTPAPEPEIEAPPMAARFTGVLPSIEF